MHFIITIIFFIVLLLIDRKKNSSNMSISKFILLIYFGSILTSVWYSNSYKEIQSDAFSYDLIPYALLFCLFVILYFWPLIRYNEYQYKTLILPDQQILTLFSIFIIVISFISIAYFLPISITVMSVADLGDARVMATNDGNQFITPGIINTISSTASSFYNIALILAFIHIAQRGFSKISILLIISSLSYVLNVFAYAGRDGVVFWVFAFLMTYIYFKDYINDKSKKWLKYIFISASIIGIALFIAISQDRFGDDMENSFITYYGQPYINFCFYCQEGYYYTPGHDFPLFREILGLEEVPRDTWEVGNSSSWTWGTFLRSLIENLGVMWAIILGLIMSTIIGAIINVRLNKFSSLFILFMYLQVVSQGVFYFRQSTRGGNLFIIISFVLWIVFEIFCNNSNNYIVKNNANTPTNKLNR